METSKYKYSRPDLYCKICALKISAKFQKSYYNKGLVFCFVKLHAKTLNVTQNAFSICGLLQILLKYKKKSKRDVRILGTTILQNNSRGLFLKV